mgnify:CR=1 FL=1
MRITIGKMALSVALALASSWGIAAPAESGRLDRILKDKRLQVCVWPDYYGISYRNPKTRQLSGLDIDLSAELARDLKALGLFAALAGSHAQAQQEPLRISYVRSPFNLQLMVMKEHGILQKHLTPLGVQAQWPEITSGAKQAQALASGDLDIGGVMNAASILMANGEGNPVRIIAGTSRPTDVFAVVSGKNGVRSVAALKGKTIAGPKGTVLHQLLVAALGREGIAMRDVNFVQMEIPQAFSAVQSGQVDAALLAANFVINAQKDGSHVLEIGRAHV